MVYRNTAIKRPIYTVFHNIGIPSFSFYNFSKSWSVLMKIISLRFCSLRIFLTAAMFLLTELQNLGHATRAGVLQDQKQRRSPATRTHCGRMGQVGSAHHRQSRWRVADKMSRTPGNTTMSQSVTILQTRSHGGRGSCPHPKFVIWLPRKNPTCIVM